MKTTLIFRPALLLSTLALLTPLAYADESTHVPVGDTKMAEMFQKAEAAAQPGEAHKLLATLAGDWHADVKCWMPGQAEPAANQGKSEAKMILGDRFLHEEFSGEFMGKSFKGIGITGYDNVTKKYTSIWLDDMSTSIMKTEGTPDDTGKVITFTGDMVCPAEGKEKPVKIVITIVSPEKHIFEMHDPSLGEKSKTMEITYTKK